MGQITRTTNPTGLKQIDKKNFIVRVKDDGPAGRVFWIDHFDYSSAKLDATVQISCIAHAGNTEESFDLGSVSDLKKEPLSLRALATDKPLKFRFIFNKPGESLLVGYTDGVRALDDAGKLGSSLVDIEPTSLHGVAWKLVLPEGAGAGDKPNVLVEKSLFPTPVAAAGHPWFGVLVMPEVMRQIAISIAENTASLDDSESWAAPWGDFIASLGVDPYVEFEEDDTIAQIAWAEEIVRKFAAKGIFRHHMNKALAEMSGEQP